MAGKETEKKGPRIREKPRESGFEKSVYTYPKQAWGGRDGSGHHSGDMMNRSWWMIEHEE